jgi:hypothetical protein
MVVLLVCGRCCRSLIRYQERQQSAEDDGDAHELPAVESFAEQQERPNESERRLDHLGDADRADRDGPLREDHQPMCGDAGEEGEDQHVGPSGAAHPEHVSVGDRQREHCDGRDGADRCHEDGNVHVAAEVAGRRHIARPQQHRDNAEHVPS